MSELDGVLKNLAVKDEVYPDCVSIEGIVYSKELFRLWGHGMAIGQWYKLESREPGGAITISLIREDGSASLASQGDL